MSLPKRHGGSTDPALDDDLGALYSEPTGLFHNLVAAAGLDPSCDFRRRDLREIDFTGAILRGFDFAHSDLRGTGIRRVVHLDETTSFREAHLDPEDREWLVTRKSPPDKRSATKPTAGLLARARGQSIATFRPGVILASGGTAEIYRVSGHPELVLKIFRVEPSSEDRRRIDRIIAMRNPTLDAVTAWPQGWHQIGGRSALVLPFVTDAEAIHVLFDHLTWIHQFPDATWAFMVKVARGAALAVAAIHAAGLAVADINETNMLVARDGRVTVIDCDTFVFIGEGAASISADYTMLWAPPELESCQMREPRTANHDNFSLARLIFQLLFAGRSPLETPPGVSPDDPDPRRVFGYSQIHPLRRPSPGDVALSDLPPLLAEYFKRAFAEPSTLAGLRPTAQEWAEGLAEMLSALQPCGRAPLHRHVPGDGRTCPWCRIAAAAEGTDPFRSIARS